MTRSVRVLDEVVHRAEIPEWHFGCKFHPKVLVSFVLRLRVGVQHDRDAEMVPLRKDDVHDLAHIALLLVRLGHTDPADIDAGLFLFF